MRTSSVTKAASFFASVLALGAAPFPHSTAQSLDQDPTCVIEEGKPLIVNGGRPRHYFAPTNAVTARRVIPSGARFTDVAKITPPEEIPLGRLYFALEEADGQVLLGDYVGRPARCFTSLIGWVDRAELLSTANPRQLGSALREHPPLGRMLRAEYTNIENAFNERSTVEFRVLMKPERRTQPRLQASITAPLNGRAAIGDTFFWRYVYDIKDVSGTYWLLIGTHPQLVDSPPRSTLSDRAYISQARLQGWVRLDDVSPWPTNIVLEYNAARAAVEERKTLDAPNIIVDRMPAYTDNSRSMHRIVKEEGLEVLAEENLAIWDDAFDGGRLAGHARFLPEGLGASVLRAHVQSVGNDGWFTVATLGSLDSKLRPTEAARIRLAMLDVLDRLTRLDIVFVVDGTGSMVPEIETIGVALQLLSERLNGKTVRVDHLRFLNDLQITELPIDVRVSLLLYSDVRHPVSNTNARCRDLQDSEGSPLIPQTTYIFAKLSLKNERDAINAGIREAVCMVKFREGKAGGRYEALFHGMQRVIADSRLWQEGPFGQRVIIVVADEPGTHTRDKNPSQMERIYVEDSAERYLSTRVDVERLGYDAGPTVRASTEGDLVSVWSIFTGDEDKYEKFKNGGIDEEEMGRPRVGGVIGMPPFVGQAEWDKRILWRDFETDSSLVEARLKQFTEVIAEALQEEQRRIVGMALALERCGVRPEECGGQATSSGSPAGVVLTSGQITKILASLAYENISLDELRKFTETGFVRGVVRASDRGRLTGWRQAIMLTDYQADIYAEHLRTIKYAIDKGHFGGDCPNQGYDFLRLMFFIRDVLDEPLVSLGGIADRYAAPQGCVRVGDILSDLARDTPSQIFRLPRFVPVFDDNIFSLPLEDLLDRARADVDKLYDELEVFGWKVNCINAIRAGGHLLPADALDPDNKDVGEVCADVSPNAQPAYNWSVRLSTRYGGRYVFLPVELLP